MVRTTYSTQYVSNRHLYDYEQLLIMTKSFIELLKRGMLLG